MAKLSTASRSAAGTLSAKGRRHARNIEKAKQRRLSGTYNGQREPSHINDKRKDQIRRIAAKRVSRHRQAELKAKHG
jgi:hypothetical protein